MHSRFLPEVLATVAMMLCFGCASVQVSETLLDYRGRMTELEAELRINPSNTDALLELGVIHFQMKAYQESRVVLEKTLALDRAKVKALYYMGMVLEELGKPEEAISVYANHTQFSFLSEYGKLMEGRYLMLTGESARRQVSELVAQEEKIGSGDIAPELVAVYPFDYRGADKTYAPLRMGLAELMKRDFSQVKSVTLVERVRIQAVLEELKFGQSKFVDPATAPRVGKILKAGRIVTGFFDVPARSSFLVNVAYYDLTKAYLPEPKSKTDALGNLFALEKDIVFDVLGQMEIEPTPVERQRIEELPTRNLEAFLLFSQGLEGEAVADYGLAAQRFSQALELDPKFSMAGEELRRAEAREAAKTKRQAITTMYEFDPPAPSDGRRLIVRRLTTLGAGMEADEDDREPPEEATRAGAAVGDLPLPPDPPRPE